MNQNEVKPIKDKNEAITELAAPKNIKELKSFLGSTQHLSDFTKSLSKKTDRMRKLLKKDTNWEWTAEINDDFENLKKENTGAPCLAHFDLKKRQLCDHRCMQYWFGSHAVAERRKGVQINCFRK